MKEYHLQMAWKLSVLADQSLQTHQGESLEIIFPGYGPASVGGPDFTLAKIKLQEILWIGAVEIHYKASHWYHHKHDRDPKYNHVILHVVWENDVDIKRSNGELIPCLQLKDYMADSWFEHIEQKLSSAKSIPCAELIHQISPVIWQSQLDVALIERIERRVKEVESLYTQCACHWDEALHRFVARFMGQKINNSCMEQLAASIPYHILLRHSSALADLEALLFGQGGFLEEELKDDYYIDLQKRYIFLAHKYGLKKTYQIKDQWQYKGLRPSGFPEWRIAQWAYLLFEKGRLMSWAINVSIEQMTRECHDIGSYWKTHYRFGKKRTGRVTPSKRWLDTLVINALIPYRIAYRRNTDRLEIETLLHDYEEIAAEKNHVVDVFKSLGYGAFSARDTQAMLELYNNYCNYKKCLSCKIGHVILKKEGLL